MKISLVSLLIVISLVTCLNNPLTPNVRHSMGANISTDPTPARINLHINPPPLPSNSSVVRYSLYTSCFWNITVHPQGTATVSVNITFQVAKEYTINISVPISVEQSSVNMTGMDTWQWVGYTSKTNILQGYANFSTPNHSCQIQYHWANPTLYTGGRSYFGQVESWIPAPREILGQTYYAIDTIYTIDVHGTHNNTIEYISWITSLQTVQLDTTIWRIVITNLYHLPQFSYIPTQTQSSEGLSYVWDSKCRLTLPTMVNESGISLLSTVSELFDLIHQRTTLLPPRGYLDVLFLPDMLFGDIYASVSGDIYEPLAFYSPGRMQVLFRAGDIFYVIADNDWAKKLLIHEFVHAFMHDYVVCNLPSLLVEGFAKYYEWRLFAEWGYQAEYRQYNRACQEYVEDFRANNNDSLLSIWSWNNRDFSYKLAHYVVAFLANASDPQMFARFFSLGKITTWYTHLRFVGRLWPENLGWGFFAYCLGLATGKPMAPTLLSLDCPLVWYPIMVTAGSLLVWSCVGVYCMLAYIRTRDWSCRRWRRGWIILGTVQILFVFGFSVFSFLVVLALVVLLLVVIPRLCHSEEWWRSISASTTNRNSVAYYGGDY